MIGGNIYVTVQKYSEGIKNKIGSVAPVWEDTGQVLFGFLDLISADDNSDKMRTVVQDSTHVFVMDYEELNLASKNCRLIIKNRIYEIQYIDDLMELHEHIEIYLKYIGEEYVS